jgi:cytochrome c553
MKMKHTLLIAGLVASFGLSSSALAAGDAQAGKAKASSCSACHGPNGEGKGTNPPLAGKAEDQLVQAMKDYKSGKRANAVMKTLASPLSEQDMANLGAYYASLKGK